MEKLKFLCMVAFYRIIIIIITILLLIMMFIRTLVGLKATGTFSELPLGVQWMSWMTLEKFSFQTKKNLLPSPSSPWVCVLQGKFDSYVSESFTIKSSAYNFLRATRCPRSFWNLFYNSSPVLFLKQKVVFCQKQINSNIQKAKVQFTAPNPRFQAHLWFLQNRTCNSTKVLIGKNKGDKSV